MFEHSIKKYLTINPKIFNTQPKNKPTKSLKTPIEARNKISAENREKR